MHPFRHPGAEHRSDRVVERTLGGIPGRSDRPMFAAAQGPSLEAKLGPERVKPDPMSEPGFT